MIKIYFYVLYFYILFFKKHIYIPTYNKNQGLCAYILGPSGSSCGTEYDIILL